MYNSLGGDVPRYDEFVSVAFPDFDQEASFHYSYIPYPFVCTCRVNGLQINCLYQVRNDFHQLIETVTFISFLSTFNDETGFPLSLKPTKISRKGETHPSCVTGNDKCQVTVLSCFNTGGYALPLLCHVGSNLLLTITINYFQHSLMLLHK